MSNFEENFSVDEILAEFLVDDTPDKKNDDVDIDALLEGIINDDNVDEETKRKTREMIFYEESLHKKNKAVDFKPKGIDLNAVANATDDEPKQPILKPVEKKIVEEQVNVDDEIKIDVASESEKEVLPQPTSQEIEQQENEVDTETVVAEPVVKHDYSEEIKEVKRTEKIKASLNEDLFEDISYDLMVDENSTLNNNELALKIEKNSAAASFGFVISLFVVVIGVVYELLNNFTEILPEMLRFNSSPILFTAINLILLGLSTIASHKVFAMGISALVKFNANKYSLVSFSVVASLLQGIVVLVSAFSGILGDNIHLYSLVAVIGLLFANYGFKTTLKNARTSLKVISSKYDKFGTVIMREESANDYTQGVIHDYPMLCVNKKTEKIDNFWGRAFSPDSIDGVCKVLAPIMAILSILIGIAAGYSMKSVAVGLTAFSALSCFSAPLGFVIGSAVTMKKVVKKLVRFGGTIIGPCGIDEYSFANSILLSAKSLFPQEAITLHGIKTFGSMRIDEVLVSAASVACEGDSILSDLFKQIISGKKEMLLPVDSLQYEDGNGLVAWVEGKRVLIGTRTLLLDYGVDAPSKDYEERYKNGGKNQLVYLSVGGELSALFILELHADPAVVRTLRMLEYKNIALVINSSDPIVSAYTLEKLFNLDIDMIKIIPSRLRESYEVATAPCEEIESSVISNGSIYSTAATICQAKKVKSSLTLQIIIQLAAVLVGLAILASFTIMKDLSQLTTAFMLLYQVGFVAASAFIAKLK